jgi:hypothetical protein
MQRRSLFKLGLASAAVLLVAGGATTLLRPGLERGALTPAGREVFAAVGFAVLDKTLPAPGPQLDVAVAGLLGRIDVLISTLPQHVQNELSQLLSLLASTPGRLALSGLAQPWTQATVTEVQAALDDMRFSTLALRQQAYSALHEITAAAYFSDPSSWSLLGYPGPIKI